MPSVTVALTPEYMNCHPYISRAIYSIVPSLILLLSAPPMAYSEVFFGKVVGVSDGDTITVLTDGTERKIRLNGIDCPEKAQAYGQNAKSFTSKQSFSKRVKVISAGHDRYQRTIGEVLLPNGRSLNNLLLEKGYAWWYRRFSRDDYKRELEDRARKSKLGLWSDPQPFAPWDFRKMH